MKIEELKQQGFENVTEFYNMVADVDISTIKIAEIDSSIA